MLLLFKTVLLFYRHINLKVGCHLETIHHHCQSLAVAQVLGITQGQPLCQILWGSSLHLHHNRRVTNHLPPFTR